MAETRRGVLSWPSVAVAGLIRGWQLVVSPWYGPTCRYYPSCSSYALVAVQRHGVLKGGVLAAWRLLRCNPWSPGGVDHVPERRRSTPSELATAPGGALHDGEYDDRRDQTNDPLARLSAG